MSIRRRLAVALVLALVAVIGAAQAQQRRPTPPGTAAPASTPLSDQDRRDVQRVEAHLNELRSLTADFLQISDQGGVAEGRIYLQRPGRLRLDYADPTPLLIIAARGQIIQHDRELKQTTYLPLSSSPAAILLRERIALSGDVTVAAVERAAGTLRIGLIQTEDPRAGRLTLVFRDSPLQLANWVVVDGQGATTRVNLTNIQSGTTIDQKLFEFRDDPLQRGN
ncbi:MAG: outer membrane lipoprotein carrier protein LolA [Alphaproteobacteria bacterium]|nr:outer membrane lipoprotein carrier protein LolA [Alphaproteobacteria bacterium]